MKLLKKIVILLFVLAVCSMAAIPAFAANSMGITYEMTINTPELTVSDEAQTIVITIEANQTYLADSMTAQLTTPHGVSVTINSITNTELGFSAATVNTANGMISWYSSGWNDALGNMDIEAKTIAVYTCTIPANAAAGTYEFVFEASSITSNWFTAWEDGATVTATLTIKEAAPACEHEYKYDCDKVCAKCGEETRPEAEHKYANPCDAHCMFCHELTNEEEPAHNVIHVEAMDATCDENGNIEYWYCDICGSAWADEERTQVTNLKAVILPMAEHEYFYACDPHCMNCGALTRPDATHSMIHVEAKLADCTKDGNIEYWYCEYCGLHCLDEECTIVTNANAVKIPASCSHNAIHMAYVPAACHYNGNLEYWFCANCDVYYLDAKCTIITSLKNVIIPAEKTTADHVKAKEPDCVNDGNIEHWYCSECEQYWLDAECTLNTNLKDVVLPARGSHGITKGFRYVYNGNGTHTQYCNDCDEAIERNTNVKCSDRENDGNHLCDFCFAEENMVTPHTGGNATCSSWAVCEECSAAYGELDKDEHEPGKGSYYRNNGEDHTFVCSCGADIRNEAHDYTYDAESHKCVCGEVEKFTLTIFDFNDNFIKREVPYGTNILEYANSLVNSGVLNITALYENSFEDDYVIFGKRVFNTWMYLDEDYFEYDVPAEMTVEQDITVFAASTFTGWITYDGENWAYEVNSTLLEGWYQINESDYTVNGTGSAWYYFDENGYRVSGLTRVPYPTEPINGITYAPNAEDVAYWEAHKDTSKYSDAATAVFYFDENGKFVQYTGVEGKSYFIDGMAPWHVGLVEIEGEYYYFAGDKDNGGNVMATGNIYVTRNNTDLEVVVGGIYTFAADGKLCKYNGVTEINGVLYYYDNYRLATDAGMIKNGEGFSYVRSSAEKAGQLVVDRKYWVSKGNGLLAEGMYEFDENGLIVMENKLEGIVEVDGVYYYYEAGVKQIGAGVVALTDENGETYYIYVRSDGSLATGKYWPTTRNGLLERGEYDWGTDGKYYPGK